LINPATVFASRRLASTRRSSRRWV